MGAFDFELIPMGKIREKLHELPAASNVSVTCSPAKGKGIPETMALSNEIRALGHNVIPHFAARLVQGPDHVVEIAAWLKAEGYRECFIIGGDAPEPAGPYVDAAGFMTELLQLDHGLKRIGFGGYPDGHGMIPDDNLHKALHEKQSLLDDAGLGGWVSTQMCFDSEAIENWIRAERANGLHLPVHLGIPGSVNRKRLLTMGARLGIGSSLRYLKKNSSAIFKMFTPGDYNPSDLIRPMGDRIDELNIEALHVFTFNEIAPTETWRKNLLAKIS
jgi:methylenetetrahydrofolate reductase (NADPH)